MGKERARELDELRRALKEKERAFEEAGRKKRNDVKGTKDDGQAEAELDATRERAKEAVAVVDKRKKETVDVAWDREREARDKLARLLDEIL